MGRERPADVIVVDTSALIAILWEEAEAESFTRVIFESRSSLIAAPSVLEFFMVAGRQASRPNIAPQDIVGRPGIVIQPWTERHLTIARDAFSRYGKGQGHPAQLNFGDCISYALAKAENAPLLYKGGDFALTDIRAAV